MTGVEVLHQSREYVGVVDQPAPELIPSLLDDALDELTEVPRTRYAQAIQVEEAEQVGEQCTITIGGLAIHLISLHLVLVLITVTE